MTSAWCTMRTIIAEAMVASPNTWPRRENGRLEDRDVEEFGGVPWRPATWRALAPALCGTVESVVRHRCCLAGCGDNEFPLCGENRVVPSRRRLRQLRPKLSTGQYSPISEKPAELVLYSKRRLWYL
jgi:hypothetical protein